MKHINKRKVKLLNNSDQSASSVPFSFRSSSGAQFEKHVVEKVLKGSRTNQFLQC